MTAPRLSYALVTPVRNEHDNLQRLAESIGKQTVLPTTWLIVDTGSTDATPELMSTLASELGFVRLTSSHQPHARGAPIVRAFHAGLATLETSPDVVIKLDADVSFGPEYCEGLLAAFESRPRLGLASGICTELRDGEWRPLFGTRHHVWGASRAYRWQCLQEVLPLEERQGWDEIDSIKAQIRGWEAETFVELAFRHHRAEGARDGSSHRRWSGQGDTAHYMGYRLSYLLVRALWRAREDPSALAMVSGYLKAALQHAPQCPDDAVRAHLRSEQSARRLPLRIRESLGHSH
jgi:poly-beta-1,6-N-acetyl-D-glucosamine synthase